MNPIWPALIGATIGAVLGGIITALTTNSRNARELALKIGDKYSDEAFDKIAKAKAYLVRGTALTNEEWNQVIGVANWFDMIALCYINESADQEMLDALEIPAMCRRYYQAMVDAADRSV